MSSVRSEIQIRCGDVRWTKKSRPTFRIDEHKGSKIKRAWYCFGLLGLVATLAALVFTLAFTRFRERTFFDVELWKWELCVLLFVYGRLLSGLVLSMLVCLFERSTTWRKVGVYVLCRAKNAIQNFFWVGLILVGWHLFLEKGTKKYTVGNFFSHMSRLLVTILVGSMLWLLKTVLAETLSFALYIRNFFRWIWDSLYNQYIVETLTGPSLSEVDPDLASIDDDYRVMYKKIDLLKALSEDNVSAVTMNDLIDLVQRPVLDKSYEDENDNLVRSEDRPDIVTMQMFNTVRLSAIDGLYLEDFLRFLGKDDALKTMKLIQSEDESREIDEFVLRGWITHVFSDRKALQLSLNSTMKSVDQMHMMLDLAIGLIILVTGLIILEVFTFHIFSVYFAQVLVLAFVFGNTLKTTFEAVIYLFIIHPFNVGDRCEIDGVQMVVEEMSILQTVFRGFDNQVIIYQNSLLGTKGINNYKRSTLVEDALDFSIDVDTPGEQIVAMIARITEYVDSKKDRWCSKPMIVLRDVEDGLERLKISVWVTHKVREQNFAEIMVESSILKNEIIRILRVLEVEHRMLPQTVKRVLGTYLR